MLFKNAWSYTGWWYFFFFLPKFDIYQSIVSQLLSEPHKLSYVLIFFKRQFCLMSGLKFSLPDVTPSLPDNLFELKKCIFRPDITLLPSTSAELHPATFELVHIEHCALKIFVFNLSLKTNSTIRYCYRFYEKLGEYKLVFFELTMVLSQEFVILDWRICSAQI